MGDDTTAMDGRTQPTRESVLATDRVHVIDDPLAQVHLGRLRDRATPTRHGYYRGDESAEYAESILRRAEVYRWALKAARRRNPG